MADRKKNRRKLDEDGKPTREDYAVAKFLRFNVPTREAKLHNMEVHCFFASAAVDALMESKWSASKNAKEPLFYNRHSCVSYCQRLIQKGLFHRVERVQRKKDKGEKAEKSKKKKLKELDKEKEETGTGDELRERKQKDKKGKKDKEDCASEKMAESDSKKEQKKEEDKKDEGKKKKEKRLKLVMTDDQRFLDGEENVYVWIYDPVNAKTLLIGSLIVLSAIALCLFPLWPEIVRVGVYYVSLAAAGFVGFILSLVVLRLILFCLIWVVTLGRHHFWLLPNLTEDVGFFESFRPLYKHDAVTRLSIASKEESVSKSIKKTTKSKGQKEKSSDKEETESEQEFEMIHKTDVEDGGEEGNPMEGEEDTEDNVEEEEDEANEDEEDDEDQDQNGEEDEEAEEPDEEEEEDKKDK